MAKKSTSPSRPLVNLVASRPLVNLTTNPGTTKKVINATQKPGKIIPPPASEQK